jgi:ribosomal protein L37AE/L43A
MKSLKARYLCCPVCKRPMLKTRCDGHWECKDCDIVWFIKIVGKIGTEELE